MSQSSPAGGSDSGACPIPAGVMLLVNDGARHRDLADRPGVDHVGELRIQPRRPPVCADLHDPLVFAGRVDHGPALGDGRRQRLLDIDVLAGLASRDHLDRMPVVGGCDHHGVDVFTIENRPEILDAGDVSRDFRHLGDSLHPGW